MGILFSIIIPVFNGEQFIKRQILSLQSLPYKNWEAIFIDDGSTDSTAALLENYTLLERRICFFSISNSGAASARREGLKRIHGEYFMFLDIDDFLSPNSLNLFFDKIVEGGRPDIVTGGLNIVGNNSVKLRQTLNLMCDKLEYLRLVCLGKAGFELCSRVYNSRLLDDIDIIVPDNLRIGEDLFMLVQFISHAKQIVSFNLPVYNYVQHDASMSHIKDIKLAEETLKAGFYVSDFLKSVGLYSLLHSEIGALCLLLYSNSTRRAILKRNNPLFLKFYNQYFSWKSLTFLPLYRQLYILYLLFIRTFL